MGKILFYLILIILVLVVVSLMLPVLAFLFGLGVVTGLLVFLCSIAYKARHQRMSPSDQQEYE